MLSKMAGYTKLVDLSFLLTPDVLVQGNLPGTGSESTLASACNLVQCDIVKWEAQAVSDRQKIICSRPFNPILGPKLPLHVVLVDPEDAASSCRI